MKRSFLWIVIILSLFFSSLATQNIVSAGDDFFSKQTSKSHSKLGPTLSQAIFNSGSSAPGLSRVKKDIEKLHVYVEFSHSAVLEALGKMGEVKNVNSEYGLAEMYLPGRAIEGLLKNPHIISIREVMKPMVNGGSRLSEGLDNTFGHGVESYLRMGNLAGDGVKIGVISDGVAGLAQSVASGDLPEDVVVLNNRYNGAEGTAMLEIIYDLAPNAQLYFHDYGGSSLEFIDAINALAAQGVDIIIDDIVYLDEPFFEDSIIAKHIDQLVASSGILYFSSAGNFANSHYQGIFKPGFKNEVYEHDFNPAVSGAQRLPVKIAPYSSIIIMLQWNEPFNNSIKDLELASCPDSDTTNCFISDNWQLGEGYAPVEYIELTNTSGSYKSQFITVYSETAYSNVTFEIYVFGGATTSPDFTTRGDSTFGHSTAASVISIAATENLSIPSSYSSQGPFTMLGSVKRNKPDFIGRDCVSVTGNGDFPKTFCGTSAAAPHIGAIAALLLSNNPSLTRSQMIDALKGKSADMHTVGYDFLAGNGFVHVGLFSNEITIQKDQIWQGELSFNQQGTLSASDSTVLSVTSALNQSKSGNGIFVYDVSVKGLKDGFANLRFVGEDGKEVYRRKYVVSHRLTDFKFTDRSDLYIGLDQTQKLDMLLYPANANDAIFTYTSSDPSIVSIDNTGHITTHASGKVDITARHTVTGLRDTKTIYAGVLSTGLSITPLDPTIMGIKETVQLTAIISPAEANFTNVRWQSSYPDIASVDQNGLVTGHMQGEVTIRATSQDGLSSNEITVKVIKPLTSIYFNSPTYSIYYSGSFYTTQFGIVKTPYDSLETGLLWSSSHPDIMEVDNNGNITFKALGTSEITVTGPRGLTASTLVSFEPYPYNISFNVHRNGTEVQNAYKIIGRYGSSMTIAEMKEHYRQTVGLTPGYDVGFYRYLTYLDPIPQYFGLTADYEFNNNETLHAIEYPIEMQGLKITDAFIDQNTLHVQGRFEPKRPIDIRYRYTVSDLTVLQPNSTPVSSMCTEAEVEFACTPGSFEILKPGSVSVTLESSDGTFKDTVLIHITGEPGSYQINPQAVVSLRVQSVTSDTLVLNWSAVEGALGYHIYRSTSLSGDYVFVGETDSSQLHYTDPDRILNQPYFYKVSAKLPDGEGQVQGPHSAAMEGRTKPDPLTNVQITSLSGTQLKLGVNLSASNATVQWAYARHPEGPFTVLSENAQLEQTLAGLHPGQTYYFKVRYATDTAYGRTVSEYSPLFTAQPMPLAPAVSAYYFDSRVYVEVESPETVLMYHLLCYVNGEQVFAQQSQQSNYYEFKDLVLKEGDIATFKASVSLRYNNKYIDSPFSEVVGFSKAIQLNREIHQGGSMILKDGDGELRRPYFPAGDSVIAEATPDYGFKIYQWRINEVPLNHRKSMFTIENIQVNTTVTVEFVMIGDLNNDYQVSATDLVTMRRYLAGLTDILEKGKVGGDIDDNGSVSTTDLVRLRRRLAGLE